MRTSAGHWAPGIEAWFADQADRDVMSHSITLLETLRHANWSRRGNTTESYVIAGKQSKKDPISHDLSA
jgi:hypothetical protein